MPQTGRILAVDDEADACDTLAALLREEGYLVETAADGLKALPKLDEFAPDVVITDLKMPGLDGMGLMLKVHEEDPDRVVIVMTASSAVDTTVAAMRAGAADYLIKRTLPASRWGNSVSRRNWRVQAAGVQKDLAL